MGEFEFEENVQNKDRTRAERRKNRSRKIRQRKKLINSINSTWMGVVCDYCDFVEIKDGYLDNNNEVNKCSHAGCAKKTKAKHGHASYRHNGDYGKAIDYSPHDQRMVNNMNEEEKDNLYES